MPRLNRVLPLAWLPNVHGFAFTGYCADGTRVSLRVELRDGLHVIVNRPDNLIGWIRR